MIKKASWLTAGLVIGLIVSVTAWRLFSYEFETYGISGRLHDQSVITSIVETSINNPEVQNILRTQVMLYLKSPEGKAKMVEMMKSPEMIKVMADNIQSPELRPAILSLMGEPAFRSTLITIVREAPEMRVLRLLETAVQWDNPAPFADKNE